MLSESANATICFCFSLEPSGHAPAGNGRWSRPWSEHGTTSGTDRFCWYKCRLSRTGWAVTETGPPSWSSLTEQSCSSLDLLPNSLSGTNPAQHLRCKTVQLRCLNICYIGYFIPSLLPLLKYIKWPKSTSSNVLLCTFGSWSIFCKLFSQIQVDVLSQLLMVVHPSSKQSRVSVRYILNYEVIFF